MLWSDNKRRVLVIGMLLALTGCGFRPLYNQPLTANEAGGKKGGYNVQADLATIHIAPIRDRIGQQLRNHLLTRLNPGGSPAEPAYKLRVTLYESVQQLGVLKSSFATRANLRITASYSLSFVGPAPDEEVKLPRGSVLAISSYDISAFQFTTLTARKDARNRAIREIADDLKTRFAVYFAQARTQ